MKILKVVGIILGVLVLTVVILMLTLTGKVHVERSIVINANPDQVYAELASFKNFNSWSPWFEKDPETKYTYEGPENGVGAKMTWQSEHPEVGNGAMWIVEAEQNKKVNNRMQFGEYPGEPYANFYLEPVAEGSKVTWTYDEETSGIFKIMGAFMDMDEMLGPDYEKGLSKLKTHIESSKEYQLKATQSEISESDSTAVAI